ncbi:hypothetical protein B0I37DRAFT_397614, partial [Chaetomium sp. MPI-CAGE-AT-0009]
MAKPATVHDKGFTVLYEALQPSIDLVFVHGFTGHPRRTWTWEKTQGPSTKQAKKRGRDDGPADEARRFKIRKLPFSKSSRNSSVESIPAPSVPEYKHTGRTEDTTGGNVIDSREHRKEIYWPADLACETMPDSRILTYGYDTKIRHAAMGPVSENTVNDHAWDLLCSLEALRRSPNEIHRPILFVAHSLGGIIVKQALRRSRGPTSANTHLHNIFEATVGVLFFGTPHRGADPRNLCHHILTASAPFLGFRVNPQIVNTLMPGAELLQDLRNEFSTMCHEKKWHIVSFQEEYGLKMLFSRKVVDDQSSCLDDPIIETKRHISSNHMDMCRFSGLQDPEYAKVAAAMTFILGRVKDGTQSMSHAHREQALGRRQSQDQSLINEVIRHDLSVVGERPQDPSSPPETRSRGEDAPIRVGDGIDATLKESLVDRLFFSKIDERLTSLTGAQGKTCRWFLTKPEYAAWRAVARQSEDGGFLWIKGNPGTGKSTLMKFLFEEAKQNARDDPSQIILSFFFLARGILEEKSTTGLYRSILHQLLGKAADLKDSLEWMTAYGATGILQNGWHDEALMQTLRHAVSRLDNRSLTIFIDALDECDQSQVIGMVCFFEELCDHARDTDVKLQICFSSRHYPSVVIEKGIEVTLEHEDGHTEDIQQYIKSKLRLGKSKHAESLRSEILDKSSGIFLWVVLVLDILNTEYPNNSVSIKAMRNRLEQIPPGLNDLFEMILTRDGKNLEQLHVCLKWVLFATRPLKPQEFYFAIQLGLGTGSSGYWDQEDVELNQMKTFVRTSSKGLAEVTRNKASEVQFIHESVRNFLLDRYGGDWSDTSGNFEGHCNNMLRNCCLAQLNAPIQQSIDVPDAPSQTRAAEFKEYLNLKFPFLEYLVQNIFPHANNAQQHGMEQDGFLADFPLSCWVTLNNFLERHGIRRYRNSVNLLYILAEKNLAALIRIHPQKTSCFHAGDERYGPPIFAALATGSHQAAQEMLNDLQARARLPDYPMRNLWA